MPRPGACSLPFPASRGKLPALPGPVGRSPSAQHLGDRMTLLLSRPSSPIRRPARPGVTPSRRLPSTFAFAVAGALALPSAGRAQEPVSWGEELVFRLYLITMLMGLLTVVCRVPKRVALPIAVVLAALAFAGCHFGPIGSETFSWPLFVMLTVAGAYLAVVFAVRGLGVATGCHAAYNVMSLLLGSS